MRAARRSRRGLPAVANALAVLAMLVGLLSPLAPLPAAAQGGDRLPPPLPNPTRAVAVGSFQTALGCPADYDPSCPATELRRLPDGSFAAFLPIPAGDWGLRVAVQADQTYLLGEDGDPDGPDVLLSVPGDAAGAYVSFDPATGRIVADPTAAEATLVTDLGDSVPLRPRRQGGYRASFDAPPGTYGFQVLLDGQPVAQDRISLDQPRRVVVETDDAGQIALLDTLRDADLAVTKVDDAGQPLPGACFAATRGGALLGQACDIDDGAEDGVTTIPFPDGIDPGRADLVETLTPPDQEPAAEQTIDLDRGGNAATAVVPVDDQPDDEPADPAADPAAETPGAETPDADEPAAPGRLVVRFEDDGGAPLAGGCATILEFGFEACDDDQTGDVVFEGLGPGVYTVRESVPPGGRDPLPDQTVEVGPDGGALTFAHGAADDPAAADQTPGPAEAGGIGTLVIDVVDAAGAPLGGACFDLVGPETFPGICDQGDDGRLTIPDLPSGPYIAQQTEAAAGFRPADPQPVRVAPNDETRLLVTNEPEAAPATETPAETPTPSPVPAEPPAAETPTAEPAAPPAPGADPDAATLRLAAFDAAGQPAPGGCYAAFGDAAVEVCDDDATDADPTPGRVELRGLIPGAYDLFETRVPPGGQPAAAGVSVDLTAGRAVEAAFRPGEIPAIGAAQPAEPDDAPVAEPEPTAAAGADATITPVPGAGALVLRAEDDAGAPLPGACYDVANPAGAFGPFCDDENDGEVVLSNATPGATVVRQSRAPEGAAAAPDQSFDLAAGETREVVFRPGPTAGSLSIVAETADGQPAPGACYAIAGPAAGPVCDDDDRDGDPEPGVVLLGDLPAGDYAVSVTRPGPGFVGGEDGATVTVVAGETATARIQFEREPETGSLLVTVSRAEGVEGGFCVDALNGTLPNGPVCDGGDNDGDPAPDRVLIEGLPPATYGVVLTDLAPGVAVPGAREAVVAAGGTAEVAFALEPEAPATGNLEVRREDAAGNPVAGGCFGVIDETGADRGEACDDDNDGLVRFQDLPPGAYTVENRQPPADAGARFPRRQPATVAAGQDAEVAFQPVATGSLAVTVESDAGEPLPFCATLTGGDDAPVVLCDNRDPVADPLGGPDLVDADPAVGAILVQGIAAGDQTVAIGELPPGYAAPAPQTVAIPPDQTATAAFALPRPLGTLVVFVEDEAGNRLPATCLTLTDEATGQTGEEFCDQGDDGRLGFPDLQAGDWTVRLTRVADGFLPAADERVAVAAGQETELTLVLDRVPATPEATATATPEPTATAAPATPSPSADATATAAATAAPEETAAAEQPASPTPSPTPEPGVADLSPTPLPSPTPEPAAPGSLVVTAIGEDGQPLGFPGACYAVANGGERVRVCDNDERDADPADGVVRLDDLPPAGYTVAQTRAPEGFQIAAPVPAAVESGAVAEVAVVNPPAPVASGSLLVTTAGPDGAPAGGACYRVLDADGNALAELCDNGPGDLDPAPGAVGFAGLPAGSVTVEQTAAPRGFETAGAQSIEIVGDAETPLAFANQPLAPETGSVALQAFDETGAVVPDQCFLLNTGTEQLGPFCDDAAGQDADPNPGLVLVTDLPVGVYEAIPQVADGQAVPSDPDTATADRPFVERRTFTLARGRQNRPLEVRLVIRRQRAEDGDLLVTVRDERNRPLAGTCFELREGNRARASACDGDRADNDGRAGQVRFADVRAGRYALVQTRAPRGYEPAADQEVTVRADQIRQVGVQNLPSPAATGSLTVRTVDPADEPVGGACYAIQRGAGPQTSACDDDNDGAVAFDDLEGGAYLVRQTRAPAGYSGGNDTAVRVLAGEAVEATVEVTPRPGSVLIRKTDTAGAALGGSCFALIPKDGGAGYELCDGDPSDANAAAGLILLNGVAPGDYVLRETRAPGGYTRANDVDLTVRAGQRAEATVRNAQIPPPPRRGNVAVVKTNQAGDLLGGACFALLTGNDIVAGPRCDEDDGARDGVTNLRGVGIGDYTLRETRRPSADYAPVADARASVRENETTRVQVVNTLRPGRVLVRKTDPEGQPLAGACFDLDRDAAGAVCTGDDGRAVFDEVPVGTYRLTETQAPAGYEPAAPIAGVVVNPGATTVLDVVNTPAPPAPDTGSLQVLKFVCPAGEAGEFTAIFDSSNPGAGKLGQTAGCVRGDARFRLERPDGAVTPFEFTTGADGRFLTTLRAGEFVLTELAPDLPGDATERVLVSVNQLTTVVVLNFVAPPAPEPAAVTVTKYTCAPGLRGVVYEDFLAGCVEPRALTNDVVFRLSGQATARRVTGDGGQLGVTRFANLPAGDYRLREDVAAGAALTVYAFCGADPDAPDIRAVGPTVGLRLGEGAEAFCTFFNVPDVVTPTTGTIAVTKYACPVTAPPPGYDFEANCAPQGAGVRFALSFFDGERFAPRATGATGADSILQFIDAAPGTYELKEIGATWCRAESDSVDANGNVIVRAGQRSNVWVYNCIGPKKAPNTGAGPGSATAPAAVLPLPIGAEPVRMDAGRVVVSLADGHPAGNAARVPGPAAPIGTTLPATTRPASPARTAA